MRGLMLLGCVCACDPIGPLCDETALVGPSVELGVGERDFTAVSDGDVIDYVAGPQGGWHVWGAVRTTGLLTAGPTDSFADPANPAVDFTVNADGFQDGWRPVPRQLDGDAEGGELLGETVTLFLLDDLGADGAQATYGVQVTDACGTTASDSAEVTLRFAGSL